MNRVADFLDTINEKAGLFFSWSTLLLVILICADVLMRYLFNFTLIGVIELETYFFALSIMMAPGYAFKHDRHVRVDLFYSSYSIKRKAWINLMGGLFLLLPWALISAWVCFFYFLKSLQINEASSQPGGLPAIYILKFILCLGFVLLLLQAIASIIRSLSILFNIENPVEQKQNA